jgi:cysteine-rich repeat protein
VGCGDGILLPSEECDDGNANPNDGCTNACTIAECGDGVVQDGVEACDDGNAIETDDCLSTCAAASCGDGQIWEGNEDCDDSNTIANDGCSDLCVNEPFCYNFGSATCPSGLTEHCYEAAIACDNAGDALLACQLCQGAANACADNTTACVNGLTAIDAAACPNAVSFVYVTDAMDPLCTAGNLLDCTPAQITGSWCTAI